MYANTLLCSSFFGNVNSPTKQKAYVKAILSILLGIIYCWQITCNFETKLVETIKN
jgi:hypothetical protein